LLSNGLVAAFAFVGITVWLSYLISEKLTRGRVHGSAIAILIGLALAYAAGVATGGDRGLADIEILAGVGLLGGAMIRDFAIIATAFGVDLSEMRKAGAGAIVGLFTGVVGSFVVGATVAWSFGYTDPVSMTTIGAGAATYIVGPVTGTAIGATSDVVALSIAAGLGTTSGVAGGLAATDEKLVPYGAMTATFYTGLGCLLGPSIVFVTIRALFG
jgi:malonate transporter MadM subunit